MKKVFCILVCAVLISCATTKEESDDVIQSDAYYQMGLSFMKEEKFQDAFVEFQKAIKSNPDNKLALNALGLIYLKFEDFERAEQSFLDALDVDGKFSEAYNNLGVVYSRLKKWEKAITQFEMALENPMYPSPERAYYNIGNAFYRMGKYREALRNYRYSVRRVPNFYASYYGMALCYNKIELYGEASQALMEGIKADPEIMGNRRKAGNVFAARRVLTIDEDERNDYLDLREILNY